MTKLFRDAIQEVEKLSDDEQDAVASAMFEFLGQTRSSLLTDEQYAEVERRRADPNRVLVSFEDAMKRISEFGSSEK